MAALSRVGAVRYGGNGVCVRVTASCSARSWSKPGARPSAGWATHRASPPPPPRIGAVLRWRRGRVLVAAVAVEGESEKDLEAGVAEVRQRVLPSCVLSSHPYLMDTVLKLLLLPWVCFPCGGFPNPSSFPAARVRAAERGPPHRPREDGLTHPAATPRTNLAAAFGLLSRHSKPLFQPARGWRAAGCAAYLEHPVR
jgi:hypothetical protein